MATGRPKPNRRFALLPALLAVLSVAGCQPMPRESWRTPSPQQPATAATQSDAARALPTGTLERRIVVDTPIESQATVPAMNLPSNSAPTPQSAGNVVLLAPVPCGVLAVRVARAMPDPAAAVPTTPDPAAAGGVSAAELAVCDPPNLPSGAVDGQVFVALLAFDLRALPAGSELLYAGLELAGLDDALLGEVGGWTVRAVDLPADTVLDTLSFARIMAAPAVRPAIGWQLGRADLAPDGRNTLRIGGDGLGHLAGQLGQGVATFRIEGPLDDTNLFQWEGQGPRAPRLRLAYVPAVPAPATSRPLIVWDGTPPAGATLAAPSAKRTSAAPSERQTPAAPSARPIEGTPGP